MFVFVLSKLIYFMKAVAIKPGSFTSRKSMPAAWRGLRDKALDDVSGIEGCSFVHANGFTGGANALDAVIKMADLSIKN